MTRLVRLFAPLLGLWLLAAAPLLHAQEPPPAPKVSPLEAIEKNVAKAQSTGDDALVRGDTAWMMISTALVLLMVPGLALFYGGMVRRKNVLATMMQSMICLALVGVFWFTVGYSLAFGDPWLRVGGMSFLGWNSKLVMLHGVNPADLLPNTNVPIYLHMLFQGMFAIITPALISGALAERIRFKAYCVFTLLWMVVVYCPLAHSVWAMDWNWNYTLANNTIEKKGDKEGKQQYLDHLLDSAKDSKAKEEITKHYEDTGKGMVGALGAMNALDFAGGTVVHIAAGFSALASILVLRRRLGYPHQSFHPNSMVLTLAGAGLLWFGWFGFNGGSGLASGTLAVSAFTATQVAAATAALVWALMEWLHRGKPTALGLASGLVAGLVAVTPASGFIMPWAAMLIGLAAGVVCYFSVTLKPLFGYDDSLDAFGVHGVGGFLGAVLTGVFCSKLVNSAGQDGWVYRALPEAAGMKQITIQLIAAGSAAALAFFASLVLVKGVDLVFGFIADDRSEIDGLDLTEHGETGFDLGLASTAGSNPAESEPRKAIVPPNGMGRFEVIVEGPSSAELAATWSELCVPSAVSSAEFKAVYPYVTTVQGNRFRFRGGDRALLSAQLQRLFESKLRSPVRVKVEA